MNLSRVQELERELAKAKLQQATDNWGNWHKEGVLFLDRIVGKCFVNLYNEYSCTAFKILSYKSIGTSRSYFEIKTDGHFQIYPAAYGRRLAIPPTEGTYNSFSVIDKKKNATNYSQLQYDPRNLSETCCLNTARVTKLGYYELDGKERYKSANYSKEGPTTSVQQEFFSQPVYEIEDSVYRDFVNTASSIARLTMDLWERHQPKLKVLKKFEV